ncbi:DUF2790 domain-containing protein [Pseudomonas sp. NPDC090208]|uniref:DUF2790 domain-containing protein n=1 Tax=Pseudomonas sp. NPDC090208 TaxID=3364478 RepID=UPI0037F93F78
MYKALLIAALALTGFAAQADEAVTVTPYAYGIKLDIAKVISQTGPDEFKDVSPVQLEYLDSNGERHVVEYQVVGTGHTG